jgi:hypothetical protein
MPLLAEREVSFPHSYNYSTRMLKETEVEIEQDREKERRPAMSFSEIYFFFFILPIRAGVLSSFNYLTFYFKNILMYTFTTCFSMQQRCNKEART